MLTTRVVPDVGTAPGGRHRRGRANPALAKQMSGIVSASRTRWTASSRCGRTSTSTAGCSASRPRSRAGPPTAAGAVPAIELGQGLRLRSLRAVWPSASWWRGPSSTARPSCSWTSRRPAWTPRAAWRCGSLLGELNRDGQTILLTTHYMEEADKLCGRVAIMDKGRILALDTPAALKQSVGRGHHRHGQGDRGPGEPSAGCWRARSAG